MLSMYKPGSTINGFANQCKRNVWQVLGCLINKIDCEIDLGITLIEECNSINMIIL